MKIAVLCGYLPSLAELGRYTVDVNKAVYCARHGYTLFSPHEVDAKYADPQSHAGGFTWSRLAMLLELVDSGLFDWVWTVGADTLVTNMDRRLEDLIAVAETPGAKALPLPPAPPPSPLAPPRVIDWRAPPNWPRAGRKHLLICGERVTSLQADSFLLRCSDRGAGYVRDILAHYPDYQHAPWVEQQCMMDLREKHAALTYIVPQWMLNSYDYRRWHHVHPCYRDGTDCYGHRGQWQPGDFLIHWPAATLAERLKFLEEYRPQIVDSVPSRTLAPNESVEDRSWQ